MQSQYNSLPHALESLKKENVTLMFQSFYNIRGYLVIKS